MHIKKVKLLKTISLHYIEALAEIQLGMYQESRSFTITGQIIKPGYFSNNYFY